MIEKIEIWGRTFELNIDFDLYPGDVISEEQKERLIDFRSDAKLLSDKSFVEDYCINDNRNEINKGIDNIFKYVIPKTIFVPQSSQNRTIILLCDYKFDIEHGLAIVYNNNKFKEIASQDDIL